MKFRPLFFTPKSLTGLSILSGVLLSLGWYHWFNGLILLVALIPLFLIEDYFRTNENAKISKYGFGFYAFLTFLTFNISAAWWMACATVIGMVFVLLANSLAMALIFQLFHSTSKITTRGSGIFGLLFFWCAFEFLFQNVEISWPWLNLGNGFMYSNRFIQWYEYTGVLGGTLWILLSNVLLFNLIIEFRKTKNFTHRMIDIFLPLVFIFAPIVISLNTYFGYTEDGKAFNISLVQPNINSYFEKYGGMSPIEQLDKIIALSDNNFTDETDFLLFPETAIQGEVWESELDSNEYILRLRRIVKKHPNLRLISGMISFQQQDENSEDACQEQSKPKGHGYERHNTAIQIDSTGFIPMYYKSKFVAGVERMPYLKEFKFLQLLTFNIGEPFNNYEGQEFRSVFHDAFKNSGIAPVICYESVYGDFVAGFVKNGASIIFILTNDGWWGNTPGHKQHNAIACLRAIENRRSIARCANSGISSFFNQRGDMIKFLSYGKEGVLSNTLYANTKVTFYSTYGDYIGRVSVFFSIIIILYTLVKRLTIHRKN